MRQQGEAEEAAKNASAKLELRKQELVQEIEAQLQALQAAQEEYAGATAELEACNKAAEQAERQNARIRVEIQRIGGDLDPKRQEALRILEGLLKKNEGLEQEKEDVIQVLSSCVTAPWLLAFHIPFNLSTCHLQQAAGRLNTPVFAPNCPLRFDGFATNVMRHF